MRASEVLYHDLKALPPWPSIALSIKLWCLSSMQTVVHSEIWESGNPLSGECVFWRCIWNPPCLALHLHKRHDQDYDERGRSQCPNDGCSHDAAVMFSLVLDCMAGSCTAAPR